MGARWSVGIRPCPLLARSASQSIDAHCVGASYHTGNSRRARNHYDSGEERTEIEPGEADAENRYGALPGLPLLHYPALVGAQQGINGSLCVSWPAEGNRSIDCCTCGGVRLASTLVCD
jgi:hypothetical protein